jgi:hypothetical protein
VTITFAPDFERAMERKSLVIVDRRCTTIGELTYHHDDCVCCPTTPVPINTDDLQGAEA